MKALIPIENVDNLRNKIAKLNRRAKRNKLPEMEVVLGATSEHFEHNRMYIKQEIEVTGAVPVIEGYKYLAKIQHTAVGNLVKSMAEAVDMKFTTYKSDCAHCKTNRSRKETHILLKDGQEIQVGTECIKNYMTLMSVEYMLMVAELRALLDDEEKDCDYTMERYRPSVGVVEFLASCLESVEKYGWEAASSGQGNSTSGRVMNHYFAKRDQYFTDYGVAPSSRNMAMADEYVKNIDEMPMNGIFDHNLKMSIKFGYVNHTNCRMVAVAAKMILKAKVEKKIKAEKVNEHVGTVGAKIEVELIVKKKLGIEGMYGMSTLVIMEDKQGREFKTVSSGEFGGKIGMGDEVKVKATVKKHDLYNGTKQTVLIRAKLLGA